MTPPLAVRRILGAVALHFEVKADVIRSGENGRKNPSEVRARQVAMFLIRDILKLSYPEIGRYFDKDHTTVMAAFSKITTELAEGDEKAERDVALIRLLLQPSAPTSQPTTDIELLRVAKMELEAVASRVIGLAELIGKRLHVLEARPDVLDRAVAEWQAPTIPHAGPSAQASLARSGCAWCGKEGHAAVDCPERRERVVAEATGRKET
jgi:hypothetical protein